MSPASLFQSLFASSPSASEAVPGSTSSPTTAAVPAGQSFSSTAPFAQAATGNAAMESAGAGAVRGTTGGVEADDASGEKRPHIFHSMIAGGIGGSTGDLLMHSLDTVKTRQQGAPNVLKYMNMGDAYSTIFREEGIRRGLYGGVAPAVLGSIPTAMIFFGTYEFTKRALLDAGCEENIAYLTGGFFGDLFSSVVYVPSEVLKTRLQLQGRYNNPFFHSGYNYRGTWDAARTIVRTEGPGALFYGYKATLIRDLPFSALQFAFYEQFQKAAKWYKNSSDIGIPLEMLTGAAGGGLAGAITCPLDVVKTRVQTEVRSDIAPPKTVSKPVSKPDSTVSQKRAISTSGPTSTSPPPDPNAAKLNTTSIMRALALIYKEEGIVGMFRGVGPRFVWTSVQSGTMLFLYQTLVKQIGKHFGDGEDYGDIRIH